MKAVLNLPLGALILPGLDRILDEDAWAQIAPSIAPKPRVQPMIDDAEQGDAGHPQYGLKRLIDGLGVAREAALPLRMATADATSSGRVRLNSECFRPASATAQWPGALAAFDDIDAALSGISIIDAESERLEALAAAVCLRDVLADPNNDKTAFLVTPDRTLARRVSAELARWGIALDDSAGTPLAGTAPGRCFMALAGVVGGDIRGNLLDVLRSGFVRCGLDAQHAESAVNAIELLALRSGRTCPDIGALKLAFEAGARQWRDDAPLHPIARRLTAQAIDDAGAVLSVLTEHLGETPIGPEQPFANLVARHIALAEALSRDEADNVRLWAGQAGTRLRLELDRLSESAVNAPDLAPETYGDFLRVLLAGIRLPPATRNARIAILGPLEARLQSADRIILGGLNEGTWPAEADTDPWLSRPMRAMAGLEAPERRIGLSAHDVSQAMGAPEVILTRARRVMDSPSVTSRWLQRLDAVAGEDLAAQMRVRGKHWLELAASLDEADRFQPVPRPVPNPRVELRPRRLSVTRIETLIRDPYAIYARHVLKLQPLDPVDPTTDHRLRGTIVHAALEGALKRTAAPNIADAFSEAATNAMTEYGLSAAAQALWRARLGRIAQWLARKEHDDAHQILSRFLEADGAVALDSETGPFQLTARADRIDILRDGTARIIDYKTGVPPSDKQVKSLLSPQLPLEALILARGGFAETGPVTIGPDKDSLIYWKVTGGTPPAEQKSVGAADLVADVAAMLTGLIAYYDDPAHGYRPRVALAQERYGSDYDHLSRFGEWSLAGIGEGSE
jgi:ATP-dependent helicase/nuclease subunit B